MAIKHAAKKIIEFHRHQNPRYYYLTPQLVAFFDMKVDAPAVVGHHGI